MLLFDFDVHDCEGRSQAGLNATTSTQHTNAATLQLSCALSSLDSCHGSSTSRALSRSGIVVSG